MKKLFILLFVATMASSCLGTKSTAEKSTSVTESSSQSESLDKKETKEISKAISDELGVQVPDSDTGNQDLDNRVNEKVDQILQSLNSYKKSGDNSYRLYYDQQLRQLRALIEVGQTEKTSTSEVSQSESSTSLEKETESEIRKVVRTLPWWVWVIAVLLLQKPIFGVLSTFIPALAATQLYQRIMK